MSQNNSKFKMINSKLKIQIVDQERLKVSRSQIVNFCDRWKIIEFSLFGSVLREDFHPDSDIDILYQFAPNHGWSLFDIVHMREELEQMFGRKVDFVSKQSLQNPYRRYEILKTHQVIYRHKQTELIPRKTARGKS